MYTIKIKFIFQDSLEALDFEHDINRYLSAHCKLYNLLLGAKGSCILDNGSAYFIDQSYWKNPLQSNLECFWAEEARKVLENNGVEISCDLLGEDFIDSQICDTPNGLILSSDSYSLDSPLRCSKCLKFVPLSCLGNIKSHQWNFELEKVFYWKLHFDLYDTMQMQGITGEKSAMNQLSSINSQLNKGGLRLCQLLSNTLDLEVYYNIFNYTVSGEAFLRTCPLCHAPWQRKRKWKGEFEFKCTKCKLVSNSVFDI